MSWKYIKVDEYTFGLIEKAIADGKARSQVDAVRRAISDFVGIRYKSPQEVKMEQELTTITELSKRAMKEE